MVKPDWNWMIFLLVGIVGSAVHAAPVGVASSSVFASTAKSPPQPKTKRHPFSIPGSLTFSSRNSLTVNGAATIINTGTIMGATNGFPFSGTNGIGVTTLSSLVNSGSIQGDANGVYAHAISLLKNSGAITSGSPGVYPAPGSGVGVQSELITSLTNTGTISGTICGVRATFIAKLVNLGVIKGGQNNFPGGLIGSSGIDAGQLTSLENSGTIDGGLEGNGVSATHLVSLTNSGLITGGNDGINATTISSLTSSGTIHGGNYGIFATGSGHITLDGGTLSGGTDAISLDNGQIHSSSVVTINGRLSLSGAIVDEATANSGTLYLNLAGGTPAQMAALHALVGQTAGDVIFGGTVYQWDNFTLGGFSATSLELTVDPGLSTAGSRIDRLGLPAAYDPFYVSAALNPEGAVNQLVGREFDDAVGTIAVNNATALSEIFDSRAVELRSGTGGFDLSGLTFRPETMIASLGQTDSVLDRMMDTSVIAATRVSDSTPSLAGLYRRPDRWGAWASGTITVADEASSPTGPGFNATTGSPTLGVDYRLSSSLAFGLLATYSTTGANFSDRSRLGVQTGLGAVYGTWSDGPWYINGLAGGGYSSYDNRRVALDGTTAASGPDGDEVLANLTGGYDFNLGSGWKISPEAGLLYTHVSESSFTETGAGIYDLRMGDRDIDSIRTKLGFHVIDNFIWDRMRFTPQFRAAWYHECLDDGYGVSTSLPGAPALGSFDVQSNSQGRDFTILGVGLAITPEELHNAVTFFINYDAQVGQDNYVSHTADAGLRIGL